MATELNDEFDHNSNLVNVLCYGNKAKKHATHLIRYGHGLCRCDKNSCKICVCGVMFTGCLFADNIERAGVFRKALKKANGDKMLEHAYLREYLKRKMGKKKLAYCCNSFMYCCLPFFICPCYLGMMGRGEIQKAVKETEDDWIDNGVPHFLCPQCAVMQEARALKSFQNMVLDENYDKGSRNTAAVAPMEMIRGDSNLLMGK